MTEPGWYNDERDPSLARWHDGTGWTGFTMRKADWARPGEPPPPTDEDPPRAEPPAPAQPPSGWAPPVWEEARPVQPQKAVEASTPIGAPSAVEQPKPVEPPRSVTPPKGRPTAPRRQPVRRDRTRRWTPRLTWGSWRRPRLVLVLVGLVLGLIVLQVGVLGGDDSPGGGDDESEGAGDLQSYGAEWNTLDGSRYRLSVVPSSEPLDDASPGGCYEKPTAGHANYGFTVRIDNLSEGAAPMPDITFAVNATADGELDKSAESLAGNNRQIEVTPKSRGASCEDASAIRATGRDELAEGESADLTGVVGGIVTPVPDGLALIIRYIQIDPTHPETSSTADILAPFPAPPSD